MQRNKYYIHWIKYYHLLRTGLSTTATDWNKYYHLLRTGLCITYAEALIRTSVRLGGVRLGGGWVRLG
jgi:hypothetical protein